MPTSASFFTLAAAAGPNLLAVDLLKILACAGVVAVVLGRLRVSVIPGYLIAGAIIGPSVLGFVDDHRVEEIAELALVLLMFGIGLHLDVGQIRQGALGLLVAGLGTTLASAAVLTPAGMLFGLPWPSAVAVGMALSMSSTAVVLRILQDRRELHAAHGRLSFGILLIQDLVVIVYLALLSFLAAAGEGGAMDAPDGAAEWTRTVGGFALRVAGIGTMLVLGRLTLPRLMTEATRGGGAEVALVVASAVALASAALSVLLGFSAELGAFIAGFLLAATPFRYQVSGQLTPMRDLFMAVFFTAVGLGVNVPSIISLWWVVLIATAVLLVVKACIITAGSWAAGAPAQTAARAGFGLAQGGEFSLVVLGTAAGTYGLLDDAALSAVVGAVVLSLMLTPTLIGSTGGLAWRVRQWRTAPWISKPAFSGAPAADETEEHGAAPAPLHRPVIIAGYGPVGRAVAERVEEAGSPVTIIELNPGTVRRQLGLGRSIVFGDSRNPEVLEAAGIHDAGAIVITIPDQDAVLAGVKLVRSIRPDIFISVRTNVLSKAMLARQVGADHVTVEELATAELMARQVIDELLKREAKDPARDLPGDGASHEPEAPPADGPR